jgi:hypothetical protein
MSTFISLALQNEAFIVPAQSLSSLTLQRPGLNISEPPVVISEKRRGSKSGEAKDDKVGRLGLVVPMTLRQFP